MEMEILIDKVLENRATCSEISLVEEWVAADEANSKVFEQKRMLHNLLDSPVNPDDLDIEEALNKLHKAIRRRPGWIDYLWRYAAVAAAVVIIIGITVLYQSYDAKSKAIEAVASNEISLYAPFGSLIETVLPDGSKVWLNSNSRIMYPTVFDKEKRMVSIVGEGYFEVKADHSHPFIVATDKGSVCATGTAFNVNAYPDNPLAIVLVSGAVNVKTNTEDFPLKAGERIEINDSSKASISRADINKACSWKDGIIVFDNDPLPTVLNRLSQIYPVDFKIIDKNLLNSNYHVTFSGESLDDILHLLEIGIPMKYEEAINNDSKDRRLIYIHAAK